ncbi:MAG: alpha-amylase family glycosyl hydrolase [Planctomycetota bacterium]|jgi:glycosidase
MATEWFKKSIIYQILIDRFAGYKSGKWDKPDYLGGNIRGIIEKLDYIRALGVNTIWISPFYKTNAYHGYHITDFLKVEPHFGSEDDLKELIDGVHKAEMRIITDFVPNHCSNRHPYFIDAQENKDSIYSQWFYFKKWPNEYLCFLSFKELPKLNLDNQEARRHIVDAAKYWLSFGIDGYRLDHCIGPKHEFWKIFREEIKADYPDCVLIGEAWTRGIKLRELRTINIRAKSLCLLRLEASDRLFKEYVAELDGVLDFKFQSIVHDFAIGKATKEKVRNQLQKHYARFPPDFHLPTFLDNHDMDRFLFTCSNNRGLLQEAARIQFSIDQPKIIYYGTEVGMSQKKSISEFTEHGDLQAREPMRWEDQDKDLLESYKGIIRRCSLHDSRSR